MTGEPGKEDKRDYRRMMNRELASLTGVPSILLHSCCAPCSTAVIATLSSFFRITVFYYNPNIDDGEEYLKRAEEQKRLVGIMPTQNPVSFIEGTYDSDRYHSATAGHESDREGGERCTICYRLRLESSARAARELKLDYFTTTLSVSPMKDAYRINAIGSSLGDEYGVKWLWSDFKKDNGYKKSVELSREYNLYRQNYCGCSFSKRDASV